MLCIQIASHKKADGGCDNSVAGAEECLAPVVSEAGDEEEEAFVTDVNEEEDGGFLSSFSWANIFG